MTREEALALVREHVKNPNMVSHMLATEAIMGALARRLGQNETEWRLTGAHDLDAEQTADRMEPTARWCGVVAEAGLDDKPVLHAILAHNPANGSSIEGPMDRALFACDPLTGLVTAAALIRPEKKAELVALKSLKKRFREPSFAKGARREDMLTCSELGLELDEFLEIGLEAMKEVADELGL
jgi:predicted hydrolase (HD superfamily)